MFSAFPCWRESCRSPKGKVGETEVPYASIGKQAREHEGMRAVYEDDVLQKREEAVIYVVQSAQAADRPERSGTCWGGI
jgi:hypothetical protein